MNLFLLMKIYQLKHNGADIYAMLDAIMANGNLDSRVDRNVLKAMILKDLGTMKPRWNDTEVFVTFAAAGLQQMQREIKCNIDLFETKYNPLADYDMEYALNRDGGFTTTDTGTVTARPNLTETRTPNLTETETPNLKTTESPDLQVVEENRNAGEGTSEHYVSADNQGNSLSLRTKDDTKGENRLIETRTNGDTVTLEEGTSTLQKTGNETITKAGSETRVNDLTKTNIYDDHENRTEQGRKRMAGELIDDAMRVNAHNIYQAIVNRFMEENMIMVW